MKKSFIFSALLPYSSIIVKKIRKWENGKRQMDCGHHPL